MRKKLREKLIQNALFKTITDFFFGINKSHADTLINCF